MRLMYIVRTGETTWDREDRTDSLVGVPLTDHGREAIQRVGLELAPHEPTVVFASSGEAELETAKFLGTQMGLKVKTNTGLSEFDFGLWQVLTTEEIKHRQPRLYKQWIEKPSGIRPPNGEILAEAQKRIWTAICEILKKNKKSTTVVVLKPVVLALLRCRLKDISLDNVWNFTPQNFTWESYEIDENDQSPLRPKVQGVING
jgi:broad specificity phosphatase PhoE